MLSREAVKVSNPVLQSYISLPSIRFAIITCQDVPVVAIETRSSLREPAISAELLYFCPLHSNNDCFSQQPSKSKRRDSVKSLQVDWLQTRHNSPCRFAAEPPSNQAIGQVYSIFATGGVRSHCRAKVNHPLSYYSVRSSVFFSSYYYYDADDYCHCAIPYSSERPTK